ncbi:MAG: hypothetical protein WB763_01935 [Terriglobia bacterium]|jgi:hypothetical protein
MAEGGLLSSESQGDLFRSGQEPAATGALAKPGSAGTRALHYEPVKFINSEGRANLALARKAAESKIGSALQQAADTRATQAVPLGGVNPPLRGEAKSPPHRPWTLPPQGLAVFHGDKDTARLSHYFLPRLLLQGKRVLMLDGANCADPRLLERLARQRRVPFEQFSRQIQIARAFTCFQLTELIARVPRLLTDFPADLLIVTAFPELYYDEDVRDWNARVAFEQALANLQRLAGQSLPLTVGLFSSATTFMPSPARRWFFEKVCAAGSEVWQFNSNAEGKPRLVCRKCILPRNSLSS